IRDYKVTGVQTCALPIYTLKKADEALAKNDLPAAAKLYDSAWDLILSIGPGLEAEARHTQQGIAAARMPLAMEAQKRGDYVEARSEERRVGKEGRSRRRA